MFEADPVQVMDQVMAVVAERLKVQGVVILMVFVQVMDGELTIRFRDEAAPFASVFEMETVRSWGLMR